MGSYTRQTVLFSRDGCSRLALIFVFFIRGIHPVCGEPLFCFSANPDSLSELCGFHIDHRSRSFLLQVSGVSSHLSFCCTSLVSGFIILKTGPLVYSQTVQQLSLVFAPKVQKAGIHETRPKLSGRLCPVMSLIATVLFKEPSFGTWCIPSAAISPWPCAGRCSTAARCLVLFSVCCSAAVRRSEPGAALTSQPCFPYKFDIPAIQTVNNVPILPHFTRTRRSKN